LRQNLLKQPRFASKLKSSCLVVEIPPVGFIGMYLPLYVFCVSFQINLFLGQSFLSETLWIKSLILNSVRGTWMKFNIKNLLLISRIKKFVVCLMRMITQLYKLDDLFRWFKMLFVSNIEEQLYNSPRISYLLFY
jgi:hypothetical protein